MTAYSAASFEAYEVFLRGSEHVLKQFYKRSGLLNSYPTQLEQCQRSYVFVGEP